MNYQMTLQVAGLMLIAWGLIMAIYARFWPVTLFEAFSYAGRWIIVLALMIATAAGLIFYAQLPAVAALAAALALTVPTGIAVRFLPVNVLIDK